MKERLKKIFSWWNIVAFLLLVACAVLLFVSCTKREEYKKIEGLAFGTVYHITYKSVEPLDSVVAAALNDIDKSLSLFNEESTLSQLNQGAKMPVDILFKTVYDKGREVSEMTDGCFDMTVAPLVNAWGFGNKGREVATPTKEEIDSLLQIVGYQKCKLIIENDSMVLEGVKLDAAAIAKGYACDYVASALEMAGCQDYCVEIGGEIVVKGVNPRGTKWVVGINKPVDDAENVSGEIQRKIEMTDSAMATSGNYRNFIQQGDKKVAHTIDPRTGMPIESNLLSATVIAEDCLTADAWATACMVGGLKQSIAWMKEHKEMKAYFIWRDGEEMEEIAVIDGKVVKMSK